MSKVLSWVLDECNVLGGVGLVVHEEEVEVTGVVDEESLVAGWHQVASLPVRTVSDLSRIHEYCGFFLPFFLRTAFRTFGMTA